MVLKVDKHYECKSKHLTIFSKVITKVCMILKIKYFKGRAATP
jgi:hypothetical protein